MKVQEGRTGGKRDLFTLESDAPLDPGVVRAEFKAALQRIVDEWRGGGLIDGLRGDVGLADVDITTDAAGNPALRLGRYVSENVYTDVTVGTETTDATINLDLTSNLTLRAGVSSDGNTSVGIEFARDY